MLKSILKTTGFIAFAVWAGLVCATGLGGINVTSNLGQPLKAEIELVAVDKADRSSVSVKLASAEAFKNAGIDYPYTLPKLKFEVINRDSGDPSVKVTSSQPVNDPFVTLLVEVSWSSGKLMREYTFLLDPEDFKVQEPKTQTVKTIEPVVAVPVVPEIEPQIPEVVAASSVEAATPEVVQAAAVVPEQAAVPEQQAAPAADQTPAPVAEQEPTTSGVQTEAVTDAAPAAVVGDALSKEEAIPVVETASAEIKVVRGDSLSKIALKHKPADVSLERMLVAMYRVNAGAFVGKNMNRLQTGKIIQLPDAADLDAIKQGEAVKEVRAQVADWNVYRQQLAAAHAEAGDKTAHQEASGKISAAVAEPTTNKAPAKEVLKLSKGEAPGDTAVGAGKASAQDKANAKEEEAVAKSKALKEAQERTALLEKNVKDLQRLADLKKEGKGDAKAVVPVSAAPATVSLGAASSVNVASEVKAASPVKVAPVAPKVVEQPSMIDDLLADPVMLGGGAAILFALGGIGFVLARRKKSTGGKTSTKKEKAGVENAGATGRFATPVAPSPETGDFTQTASVEPVFQAASDEVDPIAEADLFMTFGRAAQAEEVLREALKTKPTNVPIKLKLLSVLSGRKDTNSFFTFATEIKESGDAAAWDQAAAMGREIDPTNPLYGGVEAPQAVEQKAQGGDASVDFDLGFGSKGDVTTTAVNLKAGQEESPANEVTAIFSADELRATQSAPMDFDVTGTHPELATTNSLSSTDEKMFDITTTHSGAAGLSVPSGGAPVSVVDDLVFDVTSSQPSLETTAVLPSTAAAAAPAPADDGMAFTLDFPSEFKPASAPKAEPTADIGLGDISLNLDGLGAVSDTSGGSKDEHWQEVATKLDLAKAYQEMGDAAGAKEILDEVLREGDVQQRASAQAILQQL